MEKRTKILIIGGSIGVVVIGVLAFIYRKQIKGVASKGIDKAKSVIANDLGALSTLARNVVWDSKTEKAIKTLHPKMKAKAREFINKAEQEGFKLRIGSSGGYRDFNKQNELYAKGRTTSGGKVTNAKAGQSYHNYGLAIDVVEVEPMYGYKKGYPSSRWDKIARIGKSLGLEWGGDWTSIVDKPHFQLNEGTTSQLLAKVNSGQVDSGGYVIV